VAAEQLRRATSTTADPHRNSGNDASAHSLAIVTVSIFSLRYGLKVTLQSIASDIRKACLFISGAVHG
jgi:hypothetical protein